MRNDARRTLSLAVVVVAAVFAMAAWDVRGEGGLEALKSTIGSLCSLNEEGPFAEGCCAESENGANVTFEDGFGCWGLIYGNDNTGVTYLHD